jgi:hypothetical protein
MESTITTRAASVEVSANGTAAAAGTAPKRPLTAGETAFNYLIFGLSTAATVAFAYYLFANPTALTATWDWIRQLPLVVQLLIWALGLPWMIALWIFTRPWALAIRIMLVLGTLAFTEYLVFPWKP